MSLFYRKEESVVLLQNRPDRQTKPKPAKNKPLPPTDSHCSALAHVVITRQQRGVYSYQHKWKQNKMS